MSPASLVIASPPLDSQPMTSKMCSQNRLPLGIAFRTCQSRICTRRQVFAWAVPTRWAPDQPMSRIKRLWSLTHPVMHIWVIRKGSFLEGFCSWNRRWLAIIYPVRSRFHHRTEMARLMVIRNRCGAISGDSVKSWGVPLWLSFQLRDLIRIVRRIIQR